MCGVTAKKKEHEKRKQQHEFQINRMKIQWKWEDELRSPFAERSDGKSSAPTKSIGWLDAGLVWVCSLRCHFQCSVNYHFKVERKWTSHFCKQCARWYSHSKQRLRTINCITSKSNIPDYIAQTIGWYNMYGNEILWRQFSVARANSVVLAIGESHWLSWVAFWLSGIVCFAVNLAEYSSQAYPLHAFLEFKQLTSFLCTS